MKKIILIVAACLLTIGAIAQTSETAEFDGEVKWSEVFKISRRSGSPDIIGQDGRSVYLTRIVKNKRYIEKYKLSNLQLEKSARLELKNKGKDMALVDQFMFGGKPVLYTSYFDKKTKTTSTFLQNVNPSTLTISEPVFVSATVVPKSTGLFGGLGVKAAGNAGFYANSFILSRDGELGFMDEAIFPEGVEVTDETPLKRKKAHLYDIDLKVLVESEFELPYDNFEIQRTQLGNDGLVYIAGFRVDIEIDDSRLIKRNKSVYGDLQILVLDPESGDIDALKVELQGGKKVSGYTYRIENDGSLVVSGLVMNEEGGGVSGAFYNKYDAALREVGQNSFDFEEDFITQDWSAKKKRKFERKQKKNDRRGNKKTEPTFYEYSVRDLIVKDDKSVVLLAEQYYVRVVTRTYTDANGAVRTTTDYYYYYNDIIAMSFSPEGDLQWKSLIEKYQVSVNDGGYYSSFFTVTNEDDINIVYNLRESDLIDMDELNLLERRQVKRNTIGVNVTLDGEGEQRTEKLFDFEEGGLRLVPKACSKAGDGLVFLYARAAKGDQIGIIKY